MEYRIKKTIITICHITLFLIFTSIIYAQDRIDYSNITESELSPEEAETKLRVRGTNTIYHGNAQVDTANGIITLTEEPYIITETHFVMADEIVWYREEGRVELRKNARIRSFESDDVAAGEKATYFQNPKDQIAIIEGIRGRTQRAFVYSLPNIVEADQIRIIDEDNYEAEGSVKFYNIMRKDKATAEYGLFKKKTNILILEKNAYIFYNDIKSYANKITAYLNENKSIMVGNARIISGTNVAKSDRIELYDEDDKRRAVLIKNSVLEQYPKSDKDRRGTPARRVEGERIIFEELKNESEERYLYVKGNAVIKDLSSPSSPMKGDPYRIARGDDIEYTNINNEINVKLQGNASFEQIKYRVKNKRGSNVIIEKYTELHSKSENINVNMTEDMEKETITLEKDSVIMTPTRTIFADDGEIIDRNYALMKGNVQVYEHDETVSEIKTKATCDELEAFDIQNQAESLYKLKGNVKVKQGDNFSSGDYMELISKEDTVIIDGQAYYNGNQAEASADHITAKQYEDGKNKFTLVGKAYIKQENRHASGDVIKIDEKEDYAEIDGNAYYSEKTMGVFANYIKSETVSTQEEKEMGIKVTKLTLDKNIELVDVDREIDTDHAVVYQKEYSNGDVANSAYLSGNVRIFDNGATIRGDFVDYIETRDKNKYANVSGRASVLQEDGTMYADIISYKELYLETELHTDITGTGHVRVTTEGNTITSEYGELFRRKKHNEDINNDEIFFKGDVVVEGEELNAVCQNLTLIRNPIKNTSLINEKWTLREAVEIDQPKRHATADTVEYIKKYPTSESAIIEEAYNFYHEAIVYEYIDGNNGGTSIIGEKNHDYPVYQRDNIISPDDDEEESDTGSKSVEDKAKDKLHELLSDDTIIRVEPFSQEKREYTDQRRITGDAVFYNITRNTKENTETTQIRSTLNATYNDDRLDASGETIKFVLYSYPGTNKKDTYEFMVNENLIKDKESYTEEPSEDANTKPKDKNNTEKDDAKSERTDIRKEKSKAYIFNPLFMNHYGKIDKGLPLDLFNEDEDDEGIGDDDIDRIKTSEDTAKEKSEEWSSTTKDGYQRAIIKDYEQKVMIIGDEVYGKLNADKSNEEKIEIKVWESAIFFSEEENFTSNSDYLYFKRISDKSSAETEHKDYIESIGNVKFNNKNEQTGKAGKLIVNRYTKTEQEDMDMYYDAQVRRYDVDDVLTLTGKHIYLNGKEEYIVSTGDARVISKKEQFDVTADRIEYYDKVERAYARGDVLTLLEDNKFSSDYLFFEGKKDLLTLKGSVRYTLSDSIDGYADVVVFDVETEEIIAEGGNAIIDSDTTDNGNEGNGGDKSKDSNTDNDNDSGILDDLDEGQPPEEDL